MLDRVTLYVVADNEEGRHIQAVCETVEEAEKIRAEVLQAMQSANVPEVLATGLSIHAVHADFPGDRYRLVYGTPRELPAHPLEVPVLCSSKITNTDAHSEGYLYPDDLYVCRKEALAAAVRHNNEQLKRASPASLDWALVVEVGEPLWRRYRSECMVLGGVGWEDTDLMRPVRAIHPSKEEMAGGI